MHIEGLKDKVYIGVVGMPDSGKSTFIRKIVEYTTKRIVPTDSFCDEQTLDMTIRSVQLFLRHKSLPYDIVFLDCPGHIFEYEDEAKSVLSKSSVLIHILNDRQDDVIPYNDLYKNSQTWLNKLNSLKITEDIPCLVLHSHSSRNDVLSYDILDKDDAKFNDILKYIVQFIDRVGAKRVNPVDTAVRVIQQSMQYAKNPVAMCSFGKDSIAMLQLFKIAGLLDKITIEYPNSGYDLPGIDTAFRERVQKFFNLRHAIQEFPVIQNGWTFDNHSVQEMMLCKAKMLTDRINTKHYDICFTGIRRDEEGTRAKEKFFSPRNKDGSFNMLNPQKEIFMHEIDVGIIEKYPQFRVNPLLDMCEADVWYFTRHFHLPFCREYVSVNGKRYRSLGDWPTTTPILSNARSIDEICQEVDETLIPERACRQKQDTSVKFGMEKLRKAGFF